MTEKEEIQKTLYDYTGDVEDKDTLLIKKDDYKLLIQTDTCNQVSAVKLEIFRFSIENKPQYNCVIRLAVGDETEGVWLSLFTMQVHENPEILAMMACETAEMTWGSEVIDAVDIINENGTLIRTLSLDRLAEEYSEYDEEDFEPRNSSHTLH